MLIFCSNLNESRRLRRILLSLIVVLFTCTQPIKAQMYNTLYWMHGIPQSLQSNPASQPLAGFYLGLPAVSSIYTEVTHTGFSVQDAIKVNDANDSFFINELSLLDALKERNYLISETDIELLSFGFRSGKDYFSFNVTENIGLRFSYPKDLFNLLLEGNYYFVEQDRPAQLGALSLNMMHYREFGLSYSRNINDLISAGGRVKVLQGMGNINFDDSKLNLTTNPEYYQLLLSSDLTFNTNLPFNLQPLDSIGSLDPQLDQQGLLDYALNTDNLGLAFDLGVVLRPLDRLTIAASARDLGFVNFKSNPENFNLNGSFEFTGLEINDFFGDDDDTQFDTEQLTDSILDLYNTTETINSYRVALPSKFFASASFDLTTMHRLSIMGRGQIYDGTLYPAFVASYNFQPIRQFGTALTYSAMHGNYNNWGFGAHVNLLFLQLYLVFDNIFGVTRPHTLQTFNVHFGINIVANYKDKRKDDGLPSIRW